jgi:hypothetical protein
MPGMAGSGSMGAGSVSQGRGPLAPQTFYIPFVRAPRWVVNGTTYDSTGAILPSCTVLLFETATNVWRGITLSDSNGSYVLDAAPSTAYFVVFYKAGAPDVAGTTVNTVLAVEA